MHAIDWNDLRYVLALAREGSYAAAARSLGLDPTTIARRLRAIEAALATRLFERDADGALRPTQAGEIATKRAEAMEGEVGGLTAEVQGADSLAGGSVRVTAVPILLNRVLVPAVATLAARYPRLRVELIAESRDLNLTRREADVALRLARPGDEVGGRVVARRIGSLAYAAYAASGRDEAGLPWLTYEDGMAHLPQARWIASQAQRDRIFSPLAVSDAEALLQAVLAGLGRSLLPCLVADRMCGLRRLATGPAPPPLREIWLLTHPDLRPLTRVAAVLAWIEATLEMAQQAITGVTSC